MTTAKTAPKNLAAVAAALPALIGKLQTRHKEIERQMAKLKRAGLIYATEHWRDGKYLYLLYPTKAGEPRRREYVGTDPTRIKASQDAIARAGEYDRLANELRQLDKLARDSQWTIENVVRNLSNW